MRLVHARNDSVGESVARSQPRSHGSGSANGAVRRVVPLHRIYLHRPSGARCRACHERKTMSAKLLTVGQSVPPIYGIEKATGALRFPADINLPNMLWMKILRSPHAHAKIVDVDVAAAEKMPGVAAIITHRDVPKVLFGPYQNEIYPLDEEIRFVGDTVAAVAAQDLDVAEEGIVGRRVTHEGFAA